MNDRKLRQLLAAVRADRPVVASPEFPASVVRAIARRQHEAAGLRELSLLEQLGEWFPRLAAGALAVILVALAFDLYLGGDVVSEMATASEQWLLPVNWL